MHEEQSQDLGRLELVSRLARLDVLEGGGDVLVVKVLDQGDLPVATDILVGDADYAIEQLDSLLEVVFALPKFVDLGGTPEELI